MIKILGHLIRCTGGVPAEFCRKKELKCSMRCNNLRSNYFSFRKTSHVHQHASSILHLRCFFRLVVQGKIMEPTAKAISCDVRQLHLTCVVFKDDIVINRKRRWDIVIWCLANWAVRGVLHESISEQAHFRSQCFEWTPTKTYHANTSCTKLSDLKAYFASSTIYILISCTHKILVTHSHKIPMIQWGEP